MMNILEIALNVVDWIGLKNGVFWVVTPCGSCKNHTPLQEPHGVTTQKTPFFIVTAVKTSNLGLVWLRIGTVGELL
jgi:hypothetical protein